MSTSTTMVHCPNLQDTLDNNFNTAGAATLFDPAPFFEYLNSPLNRSGYSQKVSPGQGKLKTVQLLYEQRILESEVTQPGTTKTCTAESKRGNLASTCTIDPMDYYEVEELIENTDFTYVCEANAPIIARKIQKLINALRSKIATDITEQAVALIGGVSDDVASGDKVSVSGVDYFKIATAKSSGDVDPRAMAKLDFLRRQNNYTSPAPIFGSDIYQYFQLLNAGCCSNEGLALDQILAKYGVAVAYDRRVKAALGGAEFAITSLPGALQVVYYNENDNGIAEAAGITSGTNYQKQIIYDPMTGMPMDLTMKDDCGNVSIILRATAKVCALPTDLFAPTDHMNGVTFVNGIKIVNP